MKIRYEIKEKIRIFDSYLVLANIYEKRNQKQRAYDYLKMYNDFLRKNSTSIDSKMIEDLTQTNSREERERLIETQGEKLQKELKEKEILQLQSDRQLLGIGIVISIFFLSALVVFFVIRQRNTLQEQKESEMAQTLLRSQMNPHFIFNALAVIQSYIYENTPEKTSKFLVNFSRLIRLILENSPKEFITIDTEKEILSKYLTTQKLRFEERFNFNLLIDEDLIFRRAMIPPMITQPFIENAIEHGQLHTIEEGVIQIEMSEREGMLEIIITDNGVGRTQSAKIKKNKSHKSMAIDITRQRIEILNKKYKGKGSLAIEDLVQSDRTGTKVIICLPIIYEKTIFGNDEKGTHN
jgi:LytS/YehU family sensor histidine kinase